MIDNLNIIPVHDDIRNCFEDLIVCVANWLGIDYQLMYLNQWHFGFSHDDHKLFKTIGNRILVSTKEETRTLEKYHGLQIEYNDLDKVEDVFAIVKRELAQNRPVILNLDSYWCPWADTYQKKHLTKSILITGFDEVEGSFWCVDTIPMNDGQFLGFDYISKGYKNILTFSKTDIHIDLTDWRELIRYAVKQMQKKEPNCSNGFEAIRCLAEEISYSLDFTKEITDKNFLWHNELFHKITDTSNNRRKFARTLRYIGQRFQVHELDTYAEKFEKLGLRWSSIHGMMLKCYYLSEYEAVLMRISSKLKQIADEEENLVNELLQLIESSQEVQITEEQLALSEVSYIRPENEIQEGLIDIWREFFKQERISIDADFFELGGNSLSATNVALRVRQAFNIELPLRNVFVFSTIRQLAEYIAGAEKCTYSAIEPVQKQEYYPVSAAQKRLLILNQFNEADTSYNIPIAMRIQGKLHLENIKNAFQQMVDRHESLRTWFDFVDGVLVQRIADKLEITIEYTEADEQIALELADQFVRPFDLRQAPLLRVGIIRISEEDHIILYDIHHILVDGVSMQIFRKELFDLYYGFPLPELRIQYKDYAVWQNEFYKSEVIQRQEQYWLNQYAGELQVLNLPTDFKRPEIQSFKGDSIHFELDEVITSKIKQLCLKTDITLYMLLFAAYNILLYKYTGQEDLIVGTPIAGRSHADLENIIGMFVNTLALRTHPQGDKTINEFLKEVKETTLEAYENQDYQFEELIDKVGVARDLSRNPLFDTMFVLQNMRRKKLQSDDLKFLPMGIENNISKFDITLTAREVGEGIVFYLEYCADLFLRETIERMAQHYINLLLEILKAPDVCLKEVNLLSKAEQAQLQYDFNNTHVDYPKEYTVHELFEAQVAKTPDNVAVILDNQQLTYHELNTRANQLARFLRNNGVGPDKIVALMCDRSLEMIVGILGILKAGGAYLPIDVEYPPERIQYMLTDSQTQYLVTQNAHLNRADFAGELIDINTATIYQGESSNLTQVSNSQNLAYIIYTSGSTGRPKGVMIEHQSVVNLAFSQIQRFKIAESDRVLQFSSYSFDASVEQICLALLSGATLVLIQKSILLNIPLFEKYLKEHCVTHLNVVPSFLAQIPTLDIPLKRIVVGGEACSLKLIDQWADKAEFYNQYGPTETTVTSISYCSRDMSKFVHERNRSVPLGKPIANTQIYIVDSTNHLQPIGIPGELCIAGDGLARGYLNQAELTAERFVENPFGVGKMYKTGDLARWLPNGMIEFLGRIDHQVKIRGFRIELGEIENQLLSYTGIQEVIVGVLEGQNETYLCGYYVADQEIDLMLLREYLSRNLPDYMIPLYFMRLEALPLTSNGKIDRNALPKPDQLSLGSDYTPPRDELEQKMVEIWEDILGISRVGVRDNFFKLGGHSLRAINLLLKLHKEFNVEIPLREIFRSPTVEELVRYLKGAKKSRYLAISQVEHREYYSVASAQKRLLIINKLEQDQTNYNIPVVIRLHGQLDFPRLSRAFAELIRRHESLRTCFTFIAGEPVQIIKDEIEFNIEFFIADEAEAQEIVNRFSRPFDLSQTPLFRVGLIKVSEENHVLVYDLHHIIADGISVGIMRRELFDLYLRRELPELRIQYKDYAEWQKGLLTSELMQKQKEYWISQFSGEIPILNMPTDYSRPALKSFSGEAFTVELSEEVSHKLKELTIETGTTLFIVLLAAYNILLHKYTAQTDIIVGIPIAGRPHPDLESIIGMFVNTLVLRNHPTGEQTFSELLSEVKETTLKAYENQEYQFEELISQLGIQRDLSRNPLFDTMFVMQNIEQPEVELDDLQVLPYRLDYKIAKFDITLTVAERNNRIRVNVNYCLDLFKRETMEKFVDDFVEIITLITENNQIKLKEINISNLEDVEVSVPDFEFDF